MYGMEETSYVLFKLFGMDVTSYAFFLTLGVALGIVMAVVRGRKMRLRTDIPLTFTLIGIPAAVVLARAVFCLCRMVDVMDYGVSYIFQLTSGGYSLMGVVVAVAVFMLVAVGNAVVGMLMGMAVGVRMVMSAAGNVVVMDVHSRSSLLSFFHYIWG